MGLLKRPFTEEEHNIFIINNFTIQNAKQNTMSLLKKLKSWFTGNKEAVAEEILPVESDKIDFELSNFPVVTPTVDASALPAIKSEKKSTAKKAPANKSTKKPAVKGAKNVKGK